MGKISKKIVYIFCGIILFLSASCNKKPQEDQLTKEIEKQRNMQQEVASNVEMKGDYVFGMITSDDNEIMVSKFDDIEQTINSLTDDENSFIVLESEPMISDVFYLQAALPVKENDDGQGYIVEVRVSKGEEAFTHYRLRTKDKNAVIQIFKDYYENQKAPDISHWEDVTKEFDEQ